VPVPKSLNVRLSCFVTLRITALSYWQQFPAARVLLPHAELHHLSTTINGRRRYRLDQSTPSPAAIARRSPTQCRRPRTPPRKLPRSSHESSDAPLAQYLPRASHSTIIPFYMVRYTAVILYTEFRNNTPSLQSNALPADTYFKL